MRRRSSVTFRENTGEVCGAPGPARCGGHVLVDFSVPGKSPPRDLNCQSTYGLVMRYNFQCRYRTNFAEFIGEEQKKKSVIGISTDGRRITFFTRLRGQKKIQNRLIYMRESFFSNDIDRR